MESDENAPQYLETVSGEAAIAEAIRAANPSIFNRWATKFDRCNESGVSSLDQVPSLFRRDLEEAGFTALPRIRFGWAVVVHSFIGPEGYVQYKVLPADEKGDTWLQTYFSDGAAIVTGRDSGNSPRTTFLPWTGSFTESYQEHLKACAAKCAGGSVKPLRRKTFEDIRGLRRLGSLAFVSPKLALVLLLSYGGLVLAMGYLAWNVYLMFTNSGAS